jgi:hypothetical protein
MHEPMLPLAGPLGLFWSIQNQDLFKVSKTQILRQRRGLESQQRKP